VCLPTESERGPSCVFYANHMANVTRLSWPSAHHRPPAQFAPPLQCRAPSAEREGDFRPAFGREISRRLWLGAGMGLSSAANSSEFDGTLAGAAPSQPLAASRWRIEPAIRSVKGGESAIASSRVDGLGQEDSPSLLHERRHDAPRGRSALTASLDLLDLVCIRHSPRYMHGCRSKPWLGISCSC
jgi:hypothetical protein